MDRNRRYSSVPMIQLIEAVFETSRQAKKGALTAVLASGYTRAKSMAKYFKTAEEI